MTDDRVSDERFTDEEMLLRTSPATADRASTERFTDEEAAFLRYTRFGELPGPVPPTEWVEVVETETGTELPEQAFDPREWGEAGRL